MFQLTPISRRRLDAFIRNRRGYFAFWIFIVAFVASLGAELIANDRPIIVSYKGELLFPILKNYPEEKFGGFLAETDYRDPFIFQEIEAHGWMIWPLVRYSYDTRNLSPPTAVPSPPTWMLTNAQCAQGKTFAGKPAKNCGDIEWNWLGTDDQGRDVVARVIYGFRISVLFGLLLAGISSVVGIAAGAVQGYFGGWTDLLFQRFIEIWSSLPSLVPADHPVGDHHAELFRAARHTPGLFLGQSGARGARRIFTREELRLCARGAGFGAVRSQDHGQARAAERHGGDPDVSALHPQFLDHHPDIAGLFGLRPAARLAFAR